MFSLRPLVPQPRGSTNLGEGLDLSTVTGRTLARQETKRTVSRSFVLSSAVGIRREKQGANTDLQGAKDELSGLHEKDCFRQCRSNVRLAKDETAGRRCIPYGDCEPESATDNQGSNGKLMIAASGCIPHCVWRLPTVLRFLEVEEDEKG